MITYLPVASLQSGMDLSEALWALASPPATRTERGATTTHAYGVAEDAAGNFWLEMPDNFDLDVSPLASELDFDNAVTNIERVEDRP